MAEPNIVLVGLMGTGKTTTARLLSRLLELPMTDSDAYLREHYGADASHIVDSEGTAVLHEHEVEHVMGALSRPGQVIAAAASVVENPRVRRALDRVFVAWLDAPDAVLRGRVASAPHRPKFDIARLRARREPYFREVADVHVDVADNPPERVARLIRAALDDAPTHHGESGAGSDGTADRGGKSR